MASDQPAVPPCDSLSAHGRTLLYIPAFLPAELRTAYEALTHESQRQQQSLAELTRELQARDTGEPPHSCSCS